MKLNGTLIGSLITSLGLVLIILSLLVPNPLFFLLIYGAIALPIGIYMIINSNNEDKIEQIRKK